MLVQKCFIFSWAENSVQKCFDPDTKRHHRNKMGDSLYYYISVRYLIWRELSNKTIPILSCGPN